MYPGTLEWPIIFQISSIDKSISPITVFKGILTESEVAKVCDFGDMIENLAPLIPDYQKRLLWVFPSIQKIEPFDINSTAINNFDMECYRLSISDENFKNNDYMPDKMKSHLIKIDNGNYKFYARLFPKLNNFEKFKVKGKKFVYFDLVL